MLSILASLLHDNDNERIQILKYQRMDRQKRESTYATKARTRPRGLTTLRWPFSSTCVPGSHPPSAGGFRRPAAMKDKNNNEFLNTLIYLSAPESFVTRRLVFARVFRQKREKKKTRSQKILDSTTWWNWYDNDGYQMCVCVCAWLRGWVGEEKSC